MAEPGEPGRRAVVAGAVALAVLGVAATIYTSLHVLLLIFAGVLFGCFLVGVSQLISRWGHVPYGVALTAVLLVLVFAMLGFLAYLAPQVTQQFARLATELSSAVQSLHERLRESETFRRAVEQIPEPSQWLSSPGQATARIGGALYSITEAFAALVVILFIGIYIAVNPQLYRRGIVLLVPPDRRPRAEQVLDRLADTLWWWTIGRLASMSIIGVFTTIGLWMLNIPLPIPLGVVAAILTFVPNIGPVVAVIPPVLLAFTQGPLTALYVVIFYIVLQLLESYLITPLIQQREVHLPPVITISAQLVFWLFAGIIGMAVATPLAAVTMTLVRELYVKDFLEKRLGNK